MISEQRRGQNRTGLRPRVLVVTGDGLNCERETALAFELGGGDPELVHISDMLRRERRLGEFEILALIGGFSNGDHLGAGTVQASRFRHRLRDDLEEFVRSGRPVIGICNGFQTLVKMGLLPGLAREGAEDREGGADSEGGRGGAAAAGGARFRPAWWERSVTITANDSGHFEDRWVHLGVEASTPCVWTSGLERLFLPVRHGEGKFLTREPGLLEHLEGAGQVVLRYVDPEGGPTQLYPWNPNGSMGAVAGICDPGGTVLGLMPHPEAYLSPYNHPSWTRPVAVGGELPQEGEGVALFRNAVRHVREARG
ncbi:MAG: phosphoribosylformylglycinamidine synthase subunit PurQ [Spirochaetales bacterium]|nr:phosphoribosylformylglycinamidine synthase subunit PurQ [Spirochaetales bacterium]